MNLVTIAEDECIGCTKCIQACPVDAIIGSKQTMHTVITTECIGCKLCIEPCPVDCIELLETPPSYSKQLAKERIAARKVRLHKHEENAFSFYKQHAEVEDKQTLIREAIARIKQKGKPNESTKTR